MKIKCKAKYIDGIIDIQDTIHVYGSFDVHEIHSILERMRREVNYPRNRDIASKLEIADSYEILVFTINKDNIGISLWNSSKYTAEDLEYITKVICEVYNVNYEEFMKNYRSRSEKYIFPRRAAMYFIRRGTNLSFARIGEFFNKHHATVMHSIKSYNVDLEYNHKVERAKYRNIRALLGIDMKKETY